MRKITEKEFDNIDFKGIIVGIPKNPELDFEFSINFECAYYTKGHHGYSERGSHPDNSSFFSIYYNDNYLPNGFFFNASSRLPWTKEYHYLNNVDYYKFDDMEEFCKWYLERKQNNTLKPVKGKEGLVWNGYEYITLPKSTRSERLKEVQEYVQKVMNIAEIKRSFESTNDPRYKEKLEQRQKDLLDWLKEEV